MNQRLLIAVMALLLPAAPALAQQKQITGKVTTMEGAPLASARVVVKGAGTVTLTNAAGVYTIRAAPGQMLQFSAIGYTSVEHLVGNASLINVRMKLTAINLEEITVTALGQTAQRRTLGTSQQTVEGPAIAQTQRSNFLNALAGRVAGLEVTSSSGNPGSSSVVTIRGVSSISSSNQPLFIVDGLPLDNRTVPTSIFASDAPNSSVSLDNRGVDFTNHASDLNPEDIESITVLKGPEAAALYGIDAANGAIVITTKRGRPGTGGMEYTNSVSVANVRGAPEVQTTYGPNAESGGAYSYFGTPYPAGARFYNNINGFFTQAVSQKHNLSFSGASGDSRITYRISGGVTRQTGNIPNTWYRRMNLQGSSTAQVTNWLSADLVISYSYSTNNQPFKGVCATPTTCVGGGPMLGLLVYPDTINARDYLTPAGQRRLITSLGAASEVDNPYYTVNKNQNYSKGDRTTVNLGLNIAPVSWGFIKLNLGSDAYTTKYLINRDPQSAAGYNNNGILDLSDDLTRNLDGQATFNFNRFTLMKGLSVSGFAGGSMSTYRTEDDALEGMNYLDPNFVSMNNTDITKRSNRTVVIRRRRMSAFGSATLSYNNYLFVNLTGRNDWTSTIPRARNSFFYPGVNGSFVFSDAFPFVRKVLTSGRLTAAFAEVGRDASPYAFRPSLLSATTTGGGFRYDFWGPNVNLKPEFAKSYEVGAELGFLNDRVGLEATFYRKTTRDQIVQNVRGSYGTGFILFNLNGATTRNTGIELTLRGTPILTRDFSWDVLANFNHSRGTTVSLPFGQTEFYNSDTWLYGNVRNGTMPGISTMSLTGFFYQRVATDSGGRKGQLLIDPTSGLPLRDVTAFKDYGYDRQPDFTIGLTNGLKYKNLAFDFLLDIRKGGDVFNATEHWLTVRGLAKGTLDRETPRIVPGILKDGKENTPNPTVNGIVVVPAANTGYYTGMSEELFIEKNINWVRLRDATLAYTLPRGVLGSKTASVYITATDLFLITNYTGLDPIVNGNTAATGGSGGVGIDFGNFPMPRTFNFGVRVGF